MLNFIDDLLNKITVYRLTLYYLTALFLAAVGFSAWGILPYNPYALVISAFIVLLTCLVINIIFASVFGASPRAESVYITAFILILIITPPLVENYLPNISFLLWASVWAMASKYIFAVGKKHIFNPAAFAVALTAVTLNESASWWVSSIYLAPLTAVGGLLILRKLRRFDLAASFLIIAVPTILGFIFFKSGDLVGASQKALFYSPLLFFTFIMLTEPMTTPPTKISRIWYGGLVGFLFAPSIHIGSFYSTPELALIVGNIFSYLARNVLLFMAAAKNETIAKIKQRMPSAPDIIAILLFLGLAGGVAAAVGPLERLFSLSSSGDESREIPGPSMTAPPAESPPKSGETKQNAPMRQIIPRFDDNDEEEEDDD